MKGARAIFVAAGIFRPANLGRTEYVLGNALGIGLDVQPICFGFECFGRRQLSLALHPER